MIGGGEAQSIAVAIEKIKPKRPLTHDLLKSVCGEFNINLKEVVIHKLEDGIFHALLICEQEGKFYEIDSRTSDALALALRFNSPIFTYESILETSGILMEDSGKETEELEAELMGTEPSTVPEGDYSKYNLKELNELLNKVLDNEEYEAAIRIRDEINRRSEEG